MAKTESQTLFEKYCADSGIPCEPILEEDTPTPDYWIAIEGQRIVAEVKEIVRNKEEQESDRLVHERGYGNAISSIPGERVRKKISDSSPQIKARTEGTYPSILLLYDRGQIVGHLSSYMIRVGMYGLEQMHFAVPKDTSVSPYSTGMSYGPKRKMTEEHNTSISAIGILFTPWPKPVELFVYHNRFAAVPLDARLLAKHGIRQFQLEAGLAARTAQWEEILSASHKS